MSEELLAIAAAVGIGLIVWAAVGMLEGHTIHEFPSCGADSPHRMTIEQKWNEDADEVARSAWERGWTNVTVELNHDRAARISAECPLSTGA